MTIPRDAQSESFRRFQTELRSLTRRGPDIPDLNTAGSRMPEAWFLGPKAENAELLKSLITETIDDHVFWRRNYHPGDPVRITEEAKRDEDYLQAVDTLRQNHRKLLAFLKKSVPFFSMRYQGHMNWDLTIPGIVGYFSAMLCNPNNVAFEGSTATTLLEILVGDDLCRMLGYRFPGDENVPADTPRPWGHITCDGTVANIEALWSARNLKYLPLALRAALEQEAALQNARDFTAVRNKDKRLLDMTPWELLNMRVDDALALTGRLTLEKGIPRKTLTDVIAQYSLQNLGLQDFSDRILANSVKPAKFFVPGAKHYSFPKAAALLGIGASNMIDVPVDEDARLDLAALRTQLAACLAQQIPVLTVVAVIGSTEESAIDPLKGILALRDEFRAQGLEFTVHADAAWGGYHASTIRTDKEMGELPDPSTSQPALPEVAPPIDLSRYAEEQFRELHRADSITVDPHKGGYIPYPAGALCYRNSAMRDLVTFSAPVVFHGDAEPTVGIYGVEGSKPGAAAAAVYLSHKVIRPSKSGYGQIIGQALFSCKLLYLRLLLLHEKHPLDPFICMPVPRLPSQRDRSLPQELLDNEADLIREINDAPTIAAALANPRAADLLRELGPDQNILAYAFNLRGNTDLGLTNRFNKALYDRLSINPGQDIYGYNLIVSTTNLEEKTYGTRFMEGYKQRLLGDAHAPGDFVTVLRSVVMDPWVAATVSGSFIDTLETEFRKALAGAYEEIIPTQVRGY